MTIPEKYSIFPQIAYGGTEADDHMRRQIEQASLMMQAAQQPSLLQGKQPWSNANANTSMQARNPPLSERAREMFLKRLGGLRAEHKLGLSEFVQCHVHAEMVYVFYFLKGKEGVAKEPIDMFPSDGLIAQFRMVLV